MRAYRKKPITVHATQWNKRGDEPRHAVEPLFQGSKAKTELGATCDHCNAPLTAHGWIETRQGGDIVCPGDWIIRGTLGNWSVCKPLIFAILYEPVEESGGAA